MLRKILKLYIKTETNVSLLSLFLKEYVLFYILKALLTPFHIQVQEISFMAGKAPPTYMYMNYAAIYFIIYECNKSLWVSSVKYQTEFFSF
jgi:hypothetical protein